MSPGKTHLIRHAELRDYAPILAIYNHYIETSSCTFDLEAFSEKARAPWFAQFGKQGPLQLVVAESLADQEIQGYACSGILNPKAAYATSVQVSVYLSPQLCGQGLGPKLYADLFQLLKQENVHRAYGGITLPNGASIALHKKFGFRQVAHYSEVGYKFERYWDVAWYELEMTKIGANGRPT